MHWEPRALEFSFKFDSNVPCDFWDKSLNPTPHRQNGEVTNSPQIGDFDNSVRQKQGKYGTAWINSEKTAWWEFLSAVRPQTVLACVEGARELGEGERSVFC